MNSVKKYWLDGIFEDDDNDNDISMEISREKDISYNISLKEIEEKVVVSKDNLYNSSPKKEIELKVVVSNEIPKDISMKNSREKDISNETTKDIKYKGKWSLKEEILCGDYIYCSNAYCSKRHYYNRNFFKRLEAKKFSHYLSVSDTKVALSNAVSRLIKEGAKIIYD